MADHNHDPHHEHGSELSEVQLRVRALETILTEKGYIDPADLVQPRAETPAFASRRATVLDKYRKGEATATQYPDANKGKISELGQ